MKNIMKYLLLSILMVNYTYALEYNIIVYKDYGFKSDNSVMGDLNDRIENNVDIDTNSNITEPTPPSTPSVDDSLCNKNEGEVCQLTFSSTDDGSIDNWSILDSNSNTISFNVVDNVVSFTVPRFGSNISITATRTDDDNMTSNPFTYTFSREVDLNRAFKNTLVNLCGIRSSTFDTYWDSNTGTYNSGISCINKGLTNTDLDTFIVLKNVKYDLNLEQNPHTNTGGLQNLAYAHDLIISNNPNLESIDLPLLETIEDTLNGSFLIYNNPNLESIDLPLLETVHIDLNTEWGIRNNNSLTSLNIPSLTSFNGNIINFSDNNLITISSTPLTNAPFLTWIDISNNYNLTNGIEFGKLIENINFMTFDISDTNISSLSFIRGKTIRGLNITNTPIDDLSPLDTTLFKSSHNTAGYLRTQSYSYSDRTFTTRMDSNSDFCNNTEDEDLFYNSSLSWSNPVNKYHLIEGVCN